MLDVGWSEMLVIAVVMIVVVGPKDLPQMLRTFGRMMTKMRGMANDFQKQFNDALKEAELDDVKKSVESLRGLNPAAEIRKQLNPFEQAAADVRAGLDNAMKPKLAETSTASETPASPAVETKPTEPVEKGIDVAGGPEAMPTPPTFPPMTDASATAPVSAPAEKAKPSRKAASLAPAKTAATKASPSKSSSAKAVSAKTSAPAKMAVARTSKPVAEKVAAAGKTPPVKTAAKPVAPAKKPARASK
ncbi:MAG: twin arginine-targeting protein translocase TatB [Mesorhizobium sp. 61-13]|nr:twin-arginine translocase subunit TatB [Mesorhizobium sp.]OJU52044.1 MAG: twin arginine-targeting protein translocase TatB [Mesorhizobium sp. 61-13]